MRNKIIIVMQIQEWRQLHKDELLKDWKFAEQKKALFAINSLE